MRSWPAFWVCVLVAWLPAAPAFAWGPLTHGIIAERAFAELVPHMPWLAPHRDTFIWGSVAADVEEAPGAQPGLSRRSHAGYTVRALWREANAMHDPSVEAFALGWAVHVAADDQFNRFAATAGQNFLDHQGAVVTGHDGSAPDALLPWAVDAALLPRSGNAQLEVARAAARHAGTPDSAPLTLLLYRVLDLDDGALDGLARLVTITCAGDADHYLEDRARFLRLGPWADAAREPRAREELGDLTPFVTQSVHSGVERARAIAESAPAPAHKKVTP